MKHISTILPRLHFADNSDFGNGGAESLTKPSGAFQNPTQNVNIFQNWNCIAALFAAVFLLLTLQTSHAAPFARTFQFTQPDGTQSEVWGEGDEFYAVFEHDGYTVLFDRVTNEIQLSTCILSATR